MKYYADPKKLDPMIAKLMVHDTNRTAAIEKLGDVLSHSTLCGPPTNLEFLHAIIDSSKFRSGHTLTNFLTDFEFTPAAIDVISPGVYTTVQDYPGRPTTGRGIPQAGPMVSGTLSITKLFICLHLDIRTLWHFKVCSFLLVATSFGTFLDEAKPTNDLLSYLQLQTYWPAIRSGPKA